jgi:hypothetical protein
VWSRLRGPDIRARQTEIRAADECSDGKASRERGTKAQPGGSRRTATVRTYRQRRDAECEVESERAAP